MRPDRVAVYSYAYVPWIRGHQKTIDPDGPAARRSSKLELLRRGDGAVSGGRLPRRSAWITSRCPTTSWRAPSTAATLHRNFMGYTTRPAPDMVAVGVSAIGDVRGRLRAEHQEAVHATTRPSTPDGFRSSAATVLDADDQLRRHVITELMCNFHVDVAADRGTTRHSTSPTTSPARLSELAARRCQRRLRSIGQTPPSRSRPSAGCSCATSRWCSTGICARRRTTTRPVFSRTV